MGFVDQVKDTIIDIFNRGPDDWRGRLGDSISLISPEGKEFTAKWVSDSREASKKLGVFRYPKIKGNIVQDLDIDSTLYTIPLHFDGKDCDVNSQAFFQAARETGPWTITHPVYGFLELQITQIKQPLDLVRDGGHIVVETEWIEAIDPETLLTAAEAAGLADGGVDELNLTAAEQFAADVDATTEALRENIEYVTTGIQNLSDAALDPIASVNDSLSNLLLSVHSGIQGTLAATVLDPLALAGQIQQTIELPLLGANDIAARLDYYSDLADSLFDWLPDSGHTKAKDKNTVALVELALSAVTAARAKIAVTGINAAQTGRAIASGRITASQVLSGLSPTVTTLPGSGTFTVTNASPVQTRAQAVESAQRLLDDLAAMLTELDTMQENFEANSIDAQYFSGRTTHALLYKVTMYAVRFLLLSAFDLAVERRTTLSRPRCPVEIVVSEYGQLGENDVYLDLFIQTNELTGDEIYLLPAGREVTIYA